MRREANIPLFLWITTAVLGHLVWGGGVDHGAKLLRQTLDIQSFARSVQNRARGVGQPLEVALLDDEHEQPDKAEPEDKKKDEAEDEKPPEEEQSDKDDPDDKQKTPPPPKKPVPELEEAKKKEPDLHKPDDKKKPEDKPAEEKKIDLKLQQEQQPAAQQLELPHKVAVKQVVKDEHQADNPNANFIADKANHVEEETQARVTSTDQNAADPHPGGNHSSSDPNPGDSEETKIAQSEDRAGSKYSAPNDQPQQAAQKLAMMQQQTAESGRPRSGGESRAEEGAKTGSDQSKTTQAAQEGQKAQAASKATDPIPESLSADNGKFTVPGPRQAFVDQAERKARQEHPLPKRRSTGQALLGYGSAGTTASGINLNLDPTSAVAAIGHNQLIKERLIDGERRKSAHRGSWHMVNMERWRSAIENYVPSVKPGNQTALNTAASPFASYLNEVHERIHPIFADNYLAALDQLPAGHPLSNQDLLTVIEIGLDEDSGKIWKMGVVRASGVTAFDVNALEAVKQASPFGPPPHEIVSPDGHVWLHWEFHRNAYACGTTFAHPFMLKGAPKSAPTPVTPPSAPPSDPRESPPDEQRHGSLEHWPRGQLAEN